MTVKEELHELVEVLDDGQAREALNYLHRLMTTTEVQSVGERDATHWEETEGEEVEYLKRGGPFTKNDSLWNIVGIGRSDEPTDVAAFKDEYLAEAFTAKDR